MSHSVVCPVPDSELDADFGCPRCHTLHGRTHEEVFGKPRSVFVPYPCVAMDDFEFTKQAAWNDYQQWRDNELSWAELDAMADAAVEWEVRNA